MSVSRMANVVRRLSSPRTFCLSSSRSYSRPDLILSRIKLQEIRVGGKPRCGYFHTSERRDIPPLIAVIVRPLIRVVALIFGRTVKKWWRKKSPEEKQKILEWAARRRSLFLGESFEECFCRCCNGAIRFSLRIDEYYVCRLYVVIVTHVL